MSLTLATSLDGVSTIADSLAVANRCGPDEVQRNLVIIHRNRPLPDQPPTGRNQTEPNKTMNGLDGWGNEPMLRPCFTVKVVLHLPFQFGGVAYQMLPISTLPHIICGARVALPRLGRSCSS